MKTRDLILTDAFWNGMISYESYVKLFYRQTRDKLYYNLSQEEIDALMNEIKDEANGNVLSPINPLPSGFNELAPNDDFLYDPTNNGYYNNTPLEYSGEKPTTVCFHKWKNYLGLNETFDYCEHCGVKKG